VRFEVCEEPKIEKPHGSPLEKTIIEALNGKDTIDFQELLEIYNCSKGGLENCLKKLQDKGYVTKANGKTWATIRNCRRDSDTLDN
jgi:DNA-binding MarR family transcriptional regulator